MQQIVDWNRIEKIHKEQPDYIFQWKYDGSYNAGDYQQLIGLRSPKLAEVIGFMKDPDKTSEIKQKIMRLKENESENLFFENEYANCSNKKNYRFCNCCHLLHLISYVHFSAYD